jgi:hypothetical protein
MEGRLYHNVLSYNNALVIEVVETCKSQKCKLQSAEYRFPTFCG